MLETLIRHGSTLPRVLLVSGYNTSDYQHLIKNTSDDSFGFDEVVDVPYEELEFKYRAKGDGLMPAGKKVQHFRHEWVAYCMNVSLYSFFNLKHFDLIMCHTTLITIQRKLHILKTSSMGSSIWCHISYRCRCVLRGEPRSICMGFC